MKDYPFYSFAEFCFSRYGPPSKEDYWASMFLLFLLVIMTVVILYLVFDAVYDSIDERKAKIRLLDGEIIEKEYEGRKVSSGTGVTTISTAGGMGVGITSVSSTTPEQYILFVKADKIYKVEVDMQEYFDYKIGQKVTLKTKIGYLSKEELNSFL